MNSYFGQLFLDLSDRIKTQVPAIKWVDQDLGQLEDYEVRPAVDFPCVLIDFAATSYTQLTEDSQIGDVTVLLRLGFAPFSQANAAAPTSVREKALEYFEIEQLLFQAVQGFQTEYSGSMMRMSTDTEQRDDKIRVRILSFATSYEDYSMLPLNQRVSANLQTDLQDE